MVLEDETLCTVGHFLGRPGPLYVHFVGGLVLGFILWELVEVVCNAHFRLASLSFLNLALLFDRFIGN